MARLIQRNLMDCCKNIHPLVKCAVDDSNLVTKTLCLSLFVFGKLRSSCKNLANSPEQCGHQDLVNKKINSTYLVDLFS